MTGIYICKAQIHPKQIATGSISRPGKIHTTFGKTLFSDSFCDCEGFEFRGYCRHTVELDSYYCRGFTPDLGQDPPQECPKCSGEVIRFTFEPEFDNAGQKRP